MIFVDVLLTVADQKRFEMVLFIKISSHSKAAIILLYGSISVMGVVLKAMT